MSASDDEPQQQSTYGFEDLARVQKMLLMPSRRQSGGLAVEIETGPSKSMAQGSKPSRLDPAHVEMTALVVH